MKTFFALATLATLMQATATTAVATAADIDIKSEFLRWKASDAGQLAYKNGFVPSRSTGSATSKVSILSADDEPTQDELTRFQNSLDAVARIQEQQPHATFSIDTPFALMTSAEFAAYVGKSGVQEHLKDMERLITPQSSVTGESTAAASSASAVNTSSSITDAATTTTITTTNNATRKLDTWVVNVDWQTKGCVTHIKNQGSCGVCWAFATVGALESGYCAHTGTLHELSEQEVVSCSRDTPSCEGYRSQWAFDWITRLNGGSICTAKSYPYTSVSGTAASCKRYAYDSSFNCERPGLGAYFYGGGDFADHTQLEAAVLKQPVAVPIAAVGDGFQYYKGGMFMGNEQTCPGGITNHEVLVVGFGTLNGVPYWKIKNQWGTSWGDNGYMYIERGYQGHKYGACGMEEYGFYPIFPAASDPRLNKRISFPRTGFHFTGAVITVYLSVYSTEMCSDRCLLDPNCIAYNWYGGGVSWCELLSTITEYNFATASVSSGYAITKAEARKSCAPIADNVDFPGNDLRTTVAASAEECCDHCSAVFGCNAFTWSKYNNGMCYLKKRAPAKSVTASPAADGTPYLKSGAVYKCESLQTNTDRPGFDLSNEPAATAAHCCGICRSTIGCWAFSWTDYNGGTCWLKARGSSTAAVTGVTSGSLFADGVY